MMRILSKKQLRELVLYSPQHIDRLDKVGKFPKRIRLGPKSEWPARIGSRESITASTSHLRLRITADLVSNRPKYLRSSGDRLPNPRPRRPHPARSSRFPGRLAYPVKKLTCQVNGLYGAPSYHLRVGK